LNRSNLKERGISIFVSLLFHVVILFFLIKIVPPVRVPLYRKVADVRIVSPERMYFPRIAGLTSTPDEELSLPGKEDIQQVESIEPGVVYLRNLAFDRDREGTDPSKTNPLFDLIPTPKAEGSFSLGIGLDKPEAEEINKEEIPSNLDLSQYSRPALSALPFNRVLTRKEGNPSGQMVQNVLIRQEGYDVAPWVKEVVDKIRNNWTLPPIDEAIAIGEVKIHVIFGKQGDLVSVKIVDSSEFLVFDSTALRAIHSSVPFSPLPDDFPLDRLEAYLVFQFNE